MMESIWTSTVTMPHFPPLWGDVRTDVLVIGGGMAGLLCARALQEAGINCAVAEAKTIAGGITKNTTAKITAQHGLIFWELLNRFGAEPVKLYWQANQDALEAFGTLCQQIDCDYTEQDHFIYSKTDLQILERELSALDAIGCPAELTQRLPLPFPTVGAVKFPKQAQFHPLKFLSAISEKLTIYENTPIQELTKDAAITDHGEIHADAFVVATHFPFLNKHGSYFLKLYQQRSYAISLENTPSLEGMYLDAQKNGLSFRSYRDCLILGGGGHRTGKNGGRLGNAEGFFQIPLPRGQNHPPLGHSGLHEPGRHSLYRPIQRQNTQPLCGHRFQQMGHDLFHGCRSDSYRPDYRKRQPLYRPVFPLPQHSAPPAGNQRLGSCQESAHPHCQAMPPHGMCPEMEFSGAQLGLSLPWFTIHRKRKAHRQSSHRSS